MNNKLYVALITFVVAMYTQSSSCQHIQIIERWDTDWELAASLFSNLAIDQNEVRIVMKGSGVKYAIYHSEKFDDTPLVLDYHKQYSFGNSVYLVERHSSVRFIKKPEGWLVCFERPLYDPENGKTNRLKVSSFITFQNGQKKNLSEDQFERLGYR